MLSLRGIQPEKWAVFDCWVHDATYKLKCHGGERAQVHSFHV